MVADGNKYWFEEDGTNGSGGGKNAGKDSWEALLGEEKETEEKGAADASGVSGASEAPQDPAPAPSAPQASGTPYRSAYEIRLSAMQGRPKAVRGKMLRTLMRYDYKEIFKILFPCYIALAAATVLYLVVSEIAGRVLSDSSGEFILYATAVASSLYGISAAVCGVAPVVMVVQRFYKNLFTAEGYLTLSIPATPQEQLLSKFLSAISALFLSLIITSLFDIVRLLPHMSYGTFLTNTQLGMLWDMCQSTDLPVLTCIEAILLIAAANIVSLHLFYVCICFGQMVTSRNKGWAAIGFYVLFTFGGGLLLSVFLVGLVMDLADGGGLVNLFRFLGLHGTLWLGVAICLALSVGAWFIEKYVMSKKINLS